jgi:hypothetical protein
MHDHAGHGRENRDQPAERENRRPLAIALGATKAFLDLCDEVVGGLSSQRGELRGGGADQRCGCVPPSPVGSAPSVLEAIPMTELAVFRLSTGDEPTDLVQGTPTSRWGVTADAAAAVVPAAWCARPTDNDDDAP